MNVTFCEFVSLRFNYLNDFSEIWNVYSLAQHRLRGYFLSKKKLQLPRDFEDTLFAMEIYEIRENGAVCLEKLNKSKQLLG